MASPPYHLLLTATSEDSEKLALMEMPTLVPSSDVESHVALVESPPHPYNILHMTYIQADSNGDNELIAIAFSYSRGNVQDSSSLYGADYYQHEKNRDSFGIPIIHSIRSMRRVTLSIRVNEWYSPSFSVLPNILTNL